MNGDKKHFYRKTTLQYTKDHIFDSIDIKGSIEKNKTIPKINEDLFLYRKCKKSTEKTDKIIELNFNETFVYDEKKPVPIFDYFSNFQFIGYGAFGTVYSAIDLVKREKIAIKVNILLCLKNKVLPKNKFSKEISSFMMKEVEIQSSFNHKNILNLEAVKENDEYLFLVMELVEGGTLKDLIIDKYYSDKEFFQDSECSLIMKNILEGLYYIHTKKIIHRDIKPGIFSFIYVKIRKYNVQKQK